MKTDIKNPINTVRKLVLLGYPRDKAILAVYRAYGLTPEQAKRLGEAA